MSHKEYIQYDAPKSLHLNSMAGYEPGPGARSMTCLHCGGPNDGPGDICSICCFEWAEKNETKEIAQA